MLTDFVTKQILENIGGSDLVKMYDKEYPASYSS